MAWHHRPGDRVKLVYSKDWSPYKGRMGTVLIRPGRGKGPRNFKVTLDDGPVVVSQGETSGR